MADQKSPALDLSETEERTVRFDGKEYPYKSRAIRTARDIARLEHAREKIFEFITSESVTEQQADDFTDLLDQTCRMVLNAPNDIHARFDDYQRLRIIEVFLVLHLPRQSATDGATQLPAPGSMPAAASVDSTAATPGIG